MQPNELIERKISLSIVRLHALLPWQGEEKIGACPSAARARFRGEGGHAPDTASVGLETVADS